MFYPKVEFVRVSRAAMNMKTLEIGDSLKYPKVFFDSNRIKHFKNLKAIHFIEIDFGEFPEEILVAGNLENLSIIRCKLRNLPFSIKKLNRLKWLNLEFNELTSLPSTIVELDSLRSLFLNDNRFMAVPFVVFDLKRVDKLNIGNYGYGQERSSFLFPFEVLEFKHILIPFQPIPSVLLYFWPP